MLYNSTEVLATALYQGVNLLDILTMLLIVCVCSVLAYHFGKRRGVWLKNHDPEAICWDERTIKRAFKTYVYLKSHQTYVCLTKEGTLLIIDTGSKLIRQLRAPRGNKIRALNFIDGILYIKVEYAKDIVQINQAELEEDELIIL